jgi:VWFA-related protein
MRPKIFFAGSPILLAAVMITIAAAQSPSPDSSTASQAGPPSQAQQSDNAAKGKAQLVKVDVVAEDSRGDAVRGLKAEDFEISGGEKRGGQKIVRFAFVDNQPSAPAAKPAGAEQPQPNGSYSNQTAFAGLTAAPTVILMDGLNSEGPSQADARHNMIRLLKTLPRDTPVVVLLLGQSLGVVQTFSSDPAVLRAAVDRAKGPSASVDTASENGSYSLSLVAMGENGDKEDYVSRQIEDFEKGNHTMDRLNFRVETTVSALSNIARYLSGYPGRKNLIWVSASFPISLEAKPTVEKDAYGENRAFAERVQEAAGALTNAQVAVYPRDARVPETDQQSLSSSGPSQASMPFSRMIPALSGSVSGERDARLASEATMDELAGDTGGKTCKNTNDLSACIEGALKDSSSYYELAYEPQNADWDGGFLTISMKTTRSGVKLSYRRSYFAQDAEAPAAQQPAEQLLKQACRDLLPSTTISLAARVVPRGPNGGLTYMLSAPMGALSLAPPGESSELGAQTALCEYGAKGDSIQFLMMKPQTVSDAAYQIWQAHGFEEYVDVPPMADTGWLRIAVVDTRTGSTGALDIPMRAEDLTRAAMPPENLQGALESSGAQAPETLVGPRVYSLAFHSSAGATGTLDWDGHNLSYYGDVGVPQSARAYFHDAFGPKFHCEEGKLVPHDAGGENPNLQLSFENPGGETAVVDLTGSKPQYFGDLPVDPSAKPFFDTLWYLCHCRAAPQNLADAPRN